MSLGASLGGAALTGAISSAMVGLYRDFYGHDRATATTYVNDNVVVCLLEDILTADESRVVRSPESRRAIDGGMTFQTDTEDEFTDAIERLTGRRVVAFLSANQARPGVACELFFLEKGAAEAGHVARGAIDR